MIRLARLASYVLITAALAAQQLPDGADLSKQAQAAAKRVHSMQFNSAIEMEMGTGMKMTMESSTAIVNPDKSRTEVKAMGNDILTLSDGETTWVYNATAKQYVKKNGAMGPGAIMSAMGMGSLPDFSKLQMQQKTVGEETLDVDGTKHDCWIVESHVPELPVPNMPSAKVKDAVSKSWIDKKMLMELQTSVSMTMEMPQAPAPMQISMKIAKKNLKIDEPVPESLFQFTPPSDAKEVENIMGNPMARSDLTGKSAPLFAVKALDGKSYGLAAMRGTPVLLDFWATWCGPCRKSIASLEKVQAMYKDQGLVVLSVNVGEAQDVVESFLKKSPAGYAVALAADSGIVDLYQVSVFPTFVMIDRDGKVVAHEIGFGQESTILRMPEKAGLQAPKK